MMDLDIYDCGNGAYGRNVDFHISFEDGTRRYTGCQTFYDYSWREIVKKIRERAREITGNKHFHTTCYR